MFIGVSAGIGRYFPRPSGDGGGAPNLLLDDYPGAESALSLRKLSNSYTGSAIEVFNGTSFLDIGFVSGELDTAAVAAFCGANVGKVSKWYDQSGNGNDFVQAATGFMPRIYNGTSVITENGKPIVSSAVDPCLLTLPTYTASNNVTMFNVAKVDPGRIAVHVSQDFTNYTLVIQNSASAINKSVGTANYFHNGAASGWTTRTDAFVALQSQSLFSLTCSTNDTDPFTSMSLGYEANAGALPMLSMQEFVVYNSDKTADQVAIDTAINSFYSVY